MIKLTTNDIEGQTSEITESLDELARQGARRMIAAALELEAEQYVQALRHLRDGHGHALVVRNGTVPPQAYGPARGWQYQDQGA